MNINVDHVLTNRDGSPIHNEGRPLTLSFVLIEALLSQSVAEIRGESPVSLKDQRHRMKLADRIEAGGEIEISAEDAALMQHRIEVRSPAFPPVIAVQAADLLDGVAPVARDREGDVFGEDLPS